MARELVDAIGLRAALELMRRYGGAKVFIPASLTPDSRLVQEFGVEVATKLVAAMPSTSIEPPTLRSVERLLRDNAVRHDFDAGASVNDLALRYRITHRQTRAILAASTAVEPRAI